MAIQRALCLTLLTWLSYTLGPNTAEEFTLTILHTNDIHSHFEQFNKHGGSCSEKDAQEEKCFGGAARLATAVEGLRSQYPHTVFLDAGDWAQGTLWYAVLQNNVTVHFMNRLGYDAMGIGNHEFDLGDTNALDFSERANFKVLGANLNMTLIPEAANYILPSTILTVGGKRIGIIGYTTTQSPFISNPGRFKFIDEVTALRKEVQKLEDLGVNKIIALGHSGFITDLKIAHEVQGVDVVVGGHSNTFLYNGEPSNKEDIPSGPYPIIVEQSSGSKVAVVQDYVFGKYLGVLHVKFNESGALMSWAGNPVLLDKNFRQDPDVKADIDVWKQPLIASQMDIVGSTGVTLNREQCKLEECIVGNMIADAYASYFVGRGAGDAWTSASIVLVNSGSIRTSLGRGDLTYEDLITLQPFQNSVDLVVLEGRHLREVMEHSCGEAYGHGGFMQIAGMKIVCNMSEQIGKRVVEMKVRCANCSEPRYYPLDNDKDYTLILSSFIINGGDSYSHFKKYAKSHSILGLLDIDLLVAYARNFSPLTPEIEDRIILLNKPDIDSINPDPYPKPKDLSTSTTSTEPTTTTPVQTTPKPTVKVKKEVRSKASTVNFDITMYVLALATLFSFCSKLV